RGNLLPTSPASGTSRPRSRRGSGPAPWRRPSVVRSVRRGSCGGLLRGLGPLANAKYAADGVDEVGPVEGVEVEVRIALLGQPRAHLGRHRGGDQAAGLGVLVQAVEQVGDP